MARLLKRNIIKPIGDGIAEVHLTNSLCAFINEHDSDNVSCVKWYAIPDGNKHYVRGRVSSSSGMVGMHRFILCFPLLIVDHINRNPLDNRRCNLRLASHQENTHNRTKKAGSNSRFLGVSKANYGKWAARIRVDGKTIALGTFVSELDASKAYNEAAIARSVFASINVIDAEPSAIAPHAAESRRLG
jgi:hypothetical protein